ncbi:MAG: pentapeptide repeat-containing protein [Pseudomonadota bacterium]
MPYQYDSVIADPIFSKKLLESEVAPASEEHLTAKIEILYLALEKKSAQYYQGNAIGSALDTFAASESFPHLIAQLEVCFEQLRHFCDEQNITIPGDQGPRLASTLLQEFLDRLKTDYFSDRRALLYGPGKKYIEILSVFINEPRIDLNFRILHIISLLSDEGLTQSCAEGCFTRLQYAANSLKNYNIFELPVLYKNYLQFLADEVIHQPILTGGEKTITQKIAEWMQYDPIAFEIHIRNFVLKRLKKKFKLKSLVIVADEYVNTIEFFFARHHQQSSTLDSYFRYLFNSFNKEATAANFVSYLGETLYKAFPTQADYMERIKFLEETTLPSLGSDPDFSLGEVLSEESGLLKEAQCLDITISERLLEQGWLVLDWPELTAKNRLFRQRNKQWQKTHPPFTPFTNAYKLFYSNLNLSWIKVDEQRKKIINVLEQEQGLQKIQRIHSSQIDLLNSLIQTPHDLATFFNHLAPSQRETALAWVKSAPGFIRSVLGYYTNEASADLLEPLLSVSSQINAQDMKELFLATFEKKFNIKTLLQTRIQKLSSNPNSNAITICTGLLKKVCSLGVVDLSSFLFYRGSEFFNENSPYLTEINFSGIKLDFSNFFEDVYRCSFAYTSMDTLSFYSGVFITDFTHVQIENTRFYQPIEQCTFKNIELLKSNFYEIVRSDFLSGNLKLVEFKRNIRQSIFHNTRISTTLFLKHVIETEFPGALLETVVFRGRVIKSDFKFAHFNYVEFYDFIINSSFASAYLYQVKFYSELKDNRFNFATLDEVKFLKKIHRSIFANTHLQKVKFAEEIFNSIFDYALFFEVTFRKNITSVNFLNINLRQSKFEGEIYHCNFSFSNLNGINFSKEIMNTKFNTADLNEVAFTGNIKNCDFIGSTIYMSSFSSIVLKDINFINTNFIQVDFSDSYLIKTDFTKTSLIHAKFQDTLLEEVTFKRVSLEAAVFKKAQFKIKVDFIESNLKNADFSDCNLLQVNFFDSNLQHLKLKNSIVTPRQLFDVFYTAGLRDFSEVYLNEDDINKSDFLLLYKDKSLETAILSDSIFNGLIKLGYRNFSKTDLSKLKLTEFIHFYYNIEYNFSAAKLPEVFLTPKRSSLVDTNRERSFSLAECLPKHQRDKREETSCIIGWSDVDTFNKNIEEKRDFEKIIINSNAFIDTLFSTNDIKKQAKLIELIDTVVVEGNAASPLLKLRTAQKLKQHFYRIGQLSSALSQGLIYENILMDFLHGNYSDVASNVALIAGSSLSESFAQQLLKQSEKSGIAGKVFLSKFLKLSAPFLRRGLSTGYIVYDLITQVSALVKGNKDTLANVMGDGLFISTDVLETGIEVLELSGVGLEMAGFITPAGAILGALTLVGIQSYHAASVVARIKALIPLTSWQTLVEGVDAFLGLNPSENIQPLLEVNQAYAIYSKNIQNVLEKNPTIKYYVVPSINYIVDNIYNICKFKPSSYLECEPNIDKHIGLIDNNLVYLEKEAQPGMLFPQLNPLKNNFNPEQIFCNPYKIGFTNKTVICNSALVIINLWVNENQNQTLLALDDGRDTAHGFSESVNTFIINNGHKAYVGGKYDDRFILSAYAIEGLLDANLGSDLLDLRLYALEKEVLTIDLPNEILKQNTTKPITIRNFERILGRKKLKDILLAARRTQFVDLQSGSELAFDEIKIAAHIYNAHLEMIVRDQTLITNLASSGNFKYIVPSHGKSSAHTSVTKHSNLIFIKHSSPANHTFLFDYHLSDLSSVTIDHGIDSYHLFFNFIFGSDSKFSNYSVKLTNFPTQAHYFFKGDTQLKIGEKDNLYAFQSSALAVQAIIEHYAPLARRLGMTLFFHQSVSNEAIIIGHTKHQVLKNDLSASKTHLLANGGENIYVITLDVLNNTYPVPDVFIYQLTTDEMQHVLDLRLLNKEIADGILANPRISVNVTEIEEDIHLSLLFALLQQDAESPFKSRTLINIVLKQGIKWYRQLKILFNRVPLQLLEVQPKLWQLQPQPLEFDASRKNIILTKDDIEKDNQIILHRSADRHVFLRDGSDLWLTTLFASTNYLNENYTILFKDFYLHAKMYTINLIFLNTELLLRDQVNDIASAEDLQAKLTSLEILAWEAVSKLRGAVSVEQQEVPKVQASLLADTLSHTHYFSSNVRSSAPSLHHNWFSPLKKRVGKTLWQLWSTGQRITTSCWYYAFHRKTIESVAAYADAPPKFWVPAIGTTVNIPKIQPQQNTAVVGQRNTDFQLSAITQYPNFNVGALQLLDLVIRKYTIKHEAKSQRKLGKRAYTQKHSNTFFLKERYEATNDLIQETMAEYQKRI